MMWPYASYAALSDVIPSEVEGPHNMRETPRELVRSFDYAQDDIFFMPGIAMVSERSLPAVLPESSYEAGRSF